VAVVPFRQPAEQGELFPFIDIGAWQGRTPPTREWMVDGVFPRRQVVISSGVGGIGKSLLMQHLVSCAVLGRTWLGHHVARGRAVYFGCEDEQAELHRRQHDINRHLGNVEMDDLVDAGLYLSSRIDKNNILATINRADWSMLPTRLFARVAERCTEVGAEYLVIDTLAEVFAGHTNNQLHVVQFVAMLRRIAIAINGIVILIMHPSMTGKADGSGENGNRQWNNKVRSRVYLHEDKKDGLVLEIMKNNYGKKGDRIPLEWRQGVYVVRGPTTGPRWND
jgi:RecA-family ATPase